MPIHTLKGSDTILTTMRKTAVNTAATAAKKPSTVAEIPATMATMIDPITVIMALINAPPLADPGDKITYLR